jgi:hypothetical protein
LATVITNLLSAIPWLGKSLVEFVWGGFIKVWTTEELNKHKINFVFVRLILFLAGTFCIYKYFIEYMFSYNVKYVKKSITERQPAEVLKRNYSIDFNTFQRLESGNYIYPYLVGLIEGDGWFTITKNGKYILFEFGIELSIRDIQLIYKIKELLGVGTVFFRNKEFNKQLNDNLYIVKECDLNMILKTDRNNVIYRIRNKSHLKEIIFPIFDKYPFLTNKQYDYIRFKNTLLSNIKYSKDLPLYVRSDIPINSVESILSRSYFIPWLVGFIEAESSFSIYKPLNSSSYIASFEITQTRGEIIMLAIRKFLRLVPKVGVDKSNNYKINASSVRGVENIIKFLSNASIKLLGYKKLQYNIWLKGLRKIPRYSRKIKIPLKY